MTGVVLFAGGGLACHGLKEAGLQLELGVEWDAEAVKVANATGLPTSSRATCEPQS